MFLRFNYIIISLLSQVKHRIAMFVFREHRHKILLLCIQKSGGRVEVLK